MIEIIATGDTTLHTAGKYCEEDILVKVPSGGGGASIDGIPAGYARADYIQFTAAQTVDTGIICNRNTKIRVVYTRDTSDTSYLFGVRSSDNTASVTAYMTATGGTWRFGNRSNERAVKASNELVQTAIMEKTRIVRGEVSISISGVNSFETIGSLTIGSGRTPEGDYGETNFIGKILIFEMYESNVLTLQLIPVVDANGVYRFWDRVSKTFFDSVTDTALGGGNL